MIRIFASRIAPKKSLGQHFLRSEAIFKKIVSVANVSPADTILEIGPGAGTLTAHLLGAGAKKIIAVEKDRRLIPELEKRFAPEVAGSRLEIIYGDILELLPSDIGLAANDYKIVANIPFYITGAVLKKFLSGDCQPSAITLLLQKEVAERIIAKDGKESILSLSVKAYGAPRYIGTVGRENFMPRPQVDSAILSIENISKNFFSGAGDEETFFKLVRAGFSSKRKMLINNLESFSGMAKADLAALFETVNIPVKSRAENLSIEEWKLLANRV